MFLSCSFNVTMCIIQETKEETDMMTYKSRLKAYLAIREMVHYHPGLGQHTLLVQSVFIVQSIACGFNINDVLSLLEKAEKQEAARNG